MKVRLCLVDEKYIEISVSKCRCLIVVLVVLLLLVVVGLWYILDKRAIIRSGCLYTYMFIYIYKKWSDSYCYFFSKATGNR